jgi:hypothetical protein
MSAPEPHGEIKTWDVNGATILCWMLFMMQPSPFPGLGLAPTMASIMVEAGENEK